MVKVKIDRPLGSRHPKYPDLIYTLNYGYIEGITGGDGEAQDVYVMGIDKPVSEFYGEIIAVIHRNNDVEDKWIAAPEGIRFTKEEITAATHFQEQYFDIEVEMIKEI